MGFNLLMRLFCLSKFLSGLLYKKMTFDQMHIGKFYHLNCNTVLCRLFNCVNPLCLFVGDGYLQPVVNSELAIDKQL